MADAVGRSSRWLLLPALIVVASTMLGGWLVWSAANVSKCIDTDQIVAVSWGDGKYGPAFYGAFVYLEPISGGVSVRGRVFIGRGNNYFHELGELGRAPSPGEAVATWGLIRWAPEGLYIGSGDRPFFFPRAKLESHR